MISTIQVTTISVLRCKHFSNLDHGKSVAHARTECVFKFVTRNMSKHQQSVGQEIEPTTPFVGRWEWGGRLVISDSGEVQETTTDARQMHNSTCIVVTCQIALVERPATCKTVSDSQYSQWCASCRPEAPPVAPHGPLCTPGDGACTQHVAQPGLISPIQAGGKVG